MDKVDAAIAALSSCLLFAGVATLTLRIGGDLEKPARSEAFIVIAATRCSCRRIIGLQELSHLTSGGLFNPEIVDPLSRAQLQGQPARLLATTGPGF